MSRFLLSLLVVLAWNCTSPVNAELTIIEDYEGQQGLAVHRLTITPAAEPVPALKHRFVVPLHKRKPGNAATHYLRSLGESSGPGIRWSRLKDQYGEQVYDWCDLDIPMNEIPMKEFRQVAQSFGHYVDLYIRQASECRECVWGLEEMDLRGPEAIAFLLPDIQESRALGQGLMLLSRLSTFERRYEDSIDYIRMNYQLGRDFGKQRFLVCQLVGFAEVGQANQSVIELISAPDSPNLYWALSELPRPVVPMRESMNLEMSLGLRMFPALLDVEEKEHSAQEWTRLVQTTINDLNAASGLLEGAIIPKDKTLAQVTTAGLALFVYPAAKQRLIDSGESSDEVEAMSVSQVLLIDTAREFQKIADDMEKWTFVPYQQRRKIRFPNRSFEDGFGPLLADLLLPATAAAYTAQMRVQWQIDALRAVEALRMHAAATGSLPKSLDEVTVVPVPRNPITEKNYEYRLDGNTAVLDLPFSDGMPGIAWRFELTLAD